LKKFLETASGLLAGLALFAIMVLTFLDVGGRKLLDHSITGSLEMTELLMVVVIFGALPLVSERGEHVVFDSLDGFLPDVVKKMQRGLVHLLCGVALIGRDHRATENFEVPLHLRHGCAVRFHRLHSPDPDAEPFEQRRI
jgi:TRAP-type C4-dicarboxylate transport system permease small subunit